jgi:high-affinity nickel permease
MQQQQQNELLATHFNGSVLGGTVNGSVILFVGISNAMYKILNELQSRLAKFVTTAGKVTNKDRCRGVKNRVYFNLKFQAKFRIITGVTFSRIVDVNRASL